MVVNVSIEVRVSIQDGKWEIRGFMSTSFCICGKLCSANITKTVKTWVLFYSCCLQSF